MSKRYKNLVAVTASVGLAATSLMATPVFASTFTDLGSAASWAQSDIAKAAELGLMNGNPDGSFQPLGTLTRQQVARILCTALNLSTSSGETSGFSDVSASDWGKPYIAAVTAANIMTGDGNGQFRPNAPITREELAVVLVRALHVKYAGAGISLTVADKDSIDSWAKDYVAAAIRYKVMSGDGVNFNPKQLSTRQEMAVIAVNFKTAQSMLGNPDTNGGGGSSDTGGGTSDNGGGTGSDTGNGGSGFDSSVPGQSPVISGEVSALNPNEIRISFPSAVYQTSALNPSNYQLIAGTRTIRNIVMGSNNASVILQLSAPLTNGETYQVNVSSITSSSYQALPAYVDTPHLFGDTVAPAVQSSSIVGNQLKLLFNKPVQNNMMVKIDGVVVVDGSTTQVTSTGAPGDYAVFTPAITNTALLTNTSHTVTIYNATDYDTPANVDAIQTSHYVGTTQSAPTVQSITPVSANSYRITFSQQLASALTTANLVVKKGTINLASDLDVQPDSSDLTGKSYIVTISNDPVNPLYPSSTTNSVSLSMTISNYENTADIMGTAYNGYVTLTRPANPAVVGGMNTISGSTLTLQFNEPLYSSVVGDYNSIVVKSSNNIIQPISGAAINNDQLVLTMTSPLASGTYSISVPANMVNDQYGHGNLALNTTAVSSQAPYLSIAANATPGVVNPGEAGIVSGDTDVVTINYGIAMNSTAAYSSYYQLDGKALPAGTLVTFTDNMKTAVRIKFPAGAFPRDESSLLTISKSVTAQNGQIVETSTGSTDSFMVNFTGNTQPVLKSAEFKLHNSGDSSTDELLLSFSEPLSNGGDVTDYKVTITNASTTVSYTVGQITGNTLELDLASSINTSQTVSVSVVPVGVNNPSMTAQDANGNLLYGGTVVYVQGSTL